MAYAVHLSDFYAKALCVPHYAPSFATLQFLEGLAKQALEYIEPNKYFDELSKRAVRQSYICALDNSQQTAEDYCTLFHSYQWALAQFFSEGKITELQGYIHIPEKLPFEILTQDGSLESKALYACLEAKVPIFSLYSGPLKHTFLELPQSFYPQPLDEESPVFFNVGKTFFFREDEENWCALMLRFVKAPDSKGKDKWSLILGHLDHEAVWQFSKQFVESLAEEKTISEDLKKIFCPLQARNHS